MLMKQPYPAASLVFALICAAAASPSWIQTNPHATLDDLTDITYGAGVYLAVGSGPTVLTSTDLKSWTPQNLPLDARDIPGGWSAAFGPEVGFVLVSATNPTLVSPDGAISNLSLL